MSVIVIGVDPGDSTGVAVIIDGKLTHAIQDTPERAVTMVELVLSRVKAADAVTLACERFISQRSRYTHQPRAQQLIGVFEAIAERYQVAFELQGPADAWALADNATLRRLGLRRTGKQVGHDDADDVNMAIRHALLALAKHHAQQFAVVMQE